MTLHERLAAAREQLVPAGINPDEAAIDVDLYARTILRWDRARLLTDRIDAPPRRARAAVLRMDRPSQRSEPTAYIVGEREFWGLDFRSRRLS